MKWLICKSRYVDGGAWIVTGWVWAESIGDWVHCRTYRHSHAAAVEAMDELRRARPHQVEEAPC